MRDSKTPSTTALAIALLVLILGGDEYGRKRLPPACLEAQIQLLKAAHLPFGSCPILVSNPLFSKLVRWFIGLFFCPKLLEGIGFRKSYMENQVRHAIASKGIQQVLVVAGGYDTLAMRLSKEYPSVTFWEVDHPATLRVKKDALSTNDCIPPNLHLVSADLTQCTLQAALTEWNNKESNSDLSFVFSTPTVVVIEGLLMYLTESQVKNLFSDVETVVGVQSVVCFDCLAWNHDTDRVDMKNSRVAHAIARRKGEPFYWGLASDISPCFFEQKEFRCWKVVDQQQRIGIENVASVKLVGGGGKHVS